MKKPFKELDLLPLFIRKGKLTEEHSKEKQFINSTVHNTDLYPIKKFYKPIL